MCPLFFAILYDPPPPLLPTGTIGNDTVIGDPLFAVPVYKDQSSLCFEVHGAANKTFNLVSDICTSVNALYTPMRNPDDGNIMSEIGIQAVGQSGTNCHEIKVLLDGCQVFVDGLEITTQKMTTDGIRVRRINGNKFRVSVPNCENIRLIMSIMCLKVTGQDMLRFDISRGLNLRPTSHGLLGKWNFSLVCNKMQCLKIHRITPHQLSTYCWGLIIALK